MATKCMVRLEGKWADEELKKFKEDYIWQDHVPNYIAYDLAKSKDSTFEITYRKKWRYRVLDFVRSIFTRGKPEAKIICFEHPYFKYTRVIKRIR